MPILKKYKQEEARQEEGEAWQPMGVILRLEWRARKFHGRVASHRDWLARPRPHLSSKLDFAAGR
jgi:hypothetical protein